MQEHLEINDVRTSFETPSDSSSIRLGIHRLDARLRSTGLDLLVKHLIPDVDVAVRPEKPAAGTGVDLVVQATQWGMRPRIRVQVRLTDHMPAAVRIEMEAVTRWSPLDWTMLRIVRDKLRGASRQRSELTQEGSERFLVDVHRLIGDLIAERGVPVSWHARLSTIESTREDILLRFTDDAVSHPAEP